MVLSDFKAQPLPSPLAAPSLHYIPHDLEQLAIARMCHLLFLSCLYQLFIEMRSPGPQCLQSLVNPSSLFKAPMGTLPYWETFWCLKPGRSTPVQSHCTLWELCCGTFHFLGGLLAPPLYQVLFFHPSSPAPKECLLQSCCMKDSVTMRIETNSTNKSNHLINSLLLCKNDGINNKTKEKPNRMIRPILLSYIKYHIG